MSKRKNRNKQVRPPHQEKKQEPQPEPQQKDDRVSAKELVTLTTAIVQLLAAIVTLVLLLVKGSK
ncbi:hypothetical protein ABEV00_21710 [Paenibacillus thiaminolyticus]|uniref:hypothetical protein n=1 Tax=Paenibacillus thiaminolyticus TaxID=49283 RepID=UPI003D2D074D